MPNHPMLHYKPGLTMDEPIAVTMAAADWVAMMTWVSQIDQGGNLDGVKHLWYGVISGQLAAQLHTAESITEARQHLGMMMDQADPRCAMCGRLPGMPTTPCIHCLDFGQ